MEVLDYVSGAITKSDGTVLRYAGDAILAEFSSAVTAVRTSIAIQSELADQNASVADDEKVQRLCLYRAFSWVESFVEQIYEIPPVITFSVSRGQ